MTLSAVYIRDNPNAAGDCDWQDLTNNWRDADATWLQERSTVRVTTTPDAEPNLANTHEGRTFYSTTNKALYLSTTGAAPFSQVLAAKALTVDESTAGTAKLGVNGHLAAGLAFDTATGNVTIGSLTVSAVGGVTTLTLTTLTAGTVSVGSGGLTINTDTTHPVTLTTGATGLQLSAGLNASGTVQSPLGQFTQLMGGGTSLGVTVVSSTLTVATSVTTPLVTSAADLTIQLGAGRALHFLTAGAGDTSIFWGAGTTVRLPWVVVNATDPGVANVPEGTIWIQP